jgi:hypothetical protein
MISVREAKVVEEKSVKEKFVEDNYETKWQCLIA